MSTPDRKRHPSRQTRYHHLLFAHYYAPSKCDRPPQCKSPPPTDYLGSNRGKPQQSIVTDPLGKDDENADAVIAELRENFSRPRTWECGKTLGNGAYGAAILVK
ncbi:hypothetical protein FHL15_010291 [Xylaria flabelliformis]|uniref:Uncharacterized protein n=1 Tax=Xylaria flabelliformis TaxID=2512241 RepID=A0A553HLJ5_9PEZI|nr:hypothetical protein FHL15_010291 [Xylaria flabelliformis]